MKTIRSGRHLGMKLTLEPAAVDSQQPLTALAPLLAYQRLRGTAQRSADTQFTRSRTRRGESMRVRQIVAICVIVCASSAVLAQSEPGVVTIGVLNDMSGTFADQSGPGSAVAAQIAV